INPDILVKRNDKIDIKEIKKENPSHIIISPGPGRPENTGISPEVIKEFKGKIPILGVCLGHQAIFQVFGGTVSYANDLYHGKTSNININNSNPIFKLLNNTIKAGRYHSLIGIKDTLPQELESIAETIDGEIMAIAHKKYSIYGLQFHPESILTPDGSKILKNFLNIV
ncbi:MAG: aminodeoxychorismate/anthranilate synthase component II, partial [Methanobrevibacter sp.]|nr:aminodeoxychorismate/anthranilate synthase component II [Methanobrevibacter sp.]